MSYDIRSALVHGRNSLNSHWSDGAYIAVQSVLNYRKENVTSEAFLSETIGAVQ